MARSGPSCSCGAPWRSAGSWTRLEGLWSVPFYLMAGAGIWLVQRRINEYYRVRGSLLHAPMPVYGWIVWGFGALAWLLLALDTAGLIPGE